VGFVGEHPSFDAVRVNKSERFAAKGTEYGEAQIATYVCLRRRVNEDV
jgi:hypothetical protein